MTNVTALVTLGLRKVKISEQKENPETPPVEVVTINKNKPMGFKASPSLILNRYTPQLCCGWDRSSQSNFFKQGYTFYIDDRIKACKPLCV